MLSRRFIGRLEGSNSLEIVDHLVLSHRIISELESGCAHDRNHLKTANYIRDSSDFRATALNSKLLANWTIVDNRSGGK